MRAPMPRYSLLNPLNRLRGAQSPQLRMLLTTERTRGAAAVGHIEGAVGMDAVPAQRHRHRLSAAKGIETQRAQLQRGRVGPQLGAARQLISGLVSKRRSPPQPNQAQRAGAACLAVRRCPRHLTRCGETLLSHSRTLVPSRLRRRRRWRVVMHGQAVRRHGGGPRRRLRPVRSWALEKHLAHTPERGRRPERGWQGRNLVGQILARAPGSGRRRRKRNHDRRLRLLCGDGHHL
jgi:hypothetical protein